MDWLLTLLQLPYDLFHGEQRRVSDAGRVRICPSTHRAAAETLPRVSRMLRLLQLPARLRYFQAVEAAAPVDGAACVVHPDAAEVLDWCAEHRPRWRRASLGGIELAYRAVLRQRCEAAIVTHLDALDSDTSRRVLASIAAGGPHGAHDHPMLVWVKLIWHFPEAPSFNYSEPQIHVAWREVRRDRRWVDGHGSDFETSASRSGACALGPCVHRATGNAAPREPLAVDGEEPAAWLDDRNGAPDDEAATFELVRALCRGQDSLVVAYVYHRLLAEGTWPVELIDELRQCFGGREPPFPSRDQARRCRAKLRARLAVLRSRAAHPATGVPLDGPTPPRRGFAA